MLQDTEDGLRESLMSVKAAIIEVFDSLLNAAKKLCEYLKKVRALTAPEHIKADTPYMFISKESLKTVKLYMLFYRRC